ncbi:MAG: hypothetical protein MK137_08665 [Rickettsiales bacterium]|nr:hypothetical protein [Rickettsiales bacterium]
MTQFEQKGILGTVIVLILVMVSLAFLLNNNDSNTEATNQNNSDAVAINSLEGPAANKEAIKVLYIGNSFISANSLPKMIAKLSESKGEVIKFNSYLRGGAKIMDHANDRSLQSLIQDNEWDFVVIQEQSQIPAFREWQLSRMMYPHVENLVNNIRESSADTKIVFFMTMAHKNGDNMNRENNPQTATYEGMQQRINDTYLNLTRQHDTLVAPVGMVWKDMRAQHPYVELYKSERHPSKAGSYLAACVFFTTFFEAPCMGADVPSRVSKKDAEKIQQLSDSILLNQ